MMNLSDIKLKALLRSCVEGDADSRIQFQQVFGELIYNYPIIVFRLPSDRAGDFYIYVFNEDRIFRRLSGFEARNGAQVKTYLNHYVLHHLFLEWERTLKEPESISLATPVSDDPEETGRTLEDLLADQTNDADESLHSGVHATESKAFLEQLNPEKRLLLKLVHLADFDLSPKDIRLLRKKSGGSYREIIADIEETRNRLLEKHEQLGALHSQLDSIYGWILSYQKELRTLSERLDSLQEESSGYRDVKRQKEDLERKLEWRYRQRSQTLEKIRQFRVTTPYKDIARLFNAPVGTVCSLIARTREEVINLMGKGEILKATAVS